MERSPGMVRRILIVFLAALMAFHLIPATAANAAPGDPARMYLGDSVEGAVIGSYKSGQALRECPNNQVLTGVRVENRNNDQPTSANAIIVRFDIQCAPLTVSAQGAVVRGTTTWQTYGTYDQSRGNTQEALCPTGTVAHRMSGTTFVGDGGARWPQQVRLECRSLELSPAGQMRVNLSGSATVVTAGQILNNTGGAQTPAWQCGSTATSGYGTNVVRGYRPQNGGEGIDGFNPSCASVPFDFGDAPQSYGSASHEINAATYMGWAVDPEPAQQFSADAKADDTPGGVAPNLDINDEDGLVAPLGELVAGITDTYTAEIYVSNKVATQDATLIGWIDFNQNGEFEANEAATATVPAGTPDGSTRQLSWSNIAARSADASGQTFARFRISTDPAVTTSTPTGAAANGEVEDHAVPVARYEPTLTVVKSSDVSEVTAAGDVVTYSFLVTNTGNVTITDVVPVEESFSGTGTLGAFSPESASLDAGESATFTAEYTVTQADIDSGELTNTATVTGTPPEGAELPPPTPSDVTVPAPADPSLSVVKSADPSDPDSFVVGQEI
ncbi:MAG: DUF7507 domain-containing protein, partial [Mycetocola sp.]